MLRTQMYGVPTYIGAGLMVKALLNTRAASPKKPQSREHQWYTLSLIAVGFSLEVFPASCLKEGVEYYRGCTLRSLDATAKRLQYESLARKQDRRGVRPPVATQRYP